MRTRAVGVLALLFVSPAFTATYTVRNTNDSGQGSLRQAIDLANSGLSAGPDRIVFRSSLKGQTIYPATQLPTLLETGLAINGDIDGDGTPNIAIVPAGKDASATYSGLQVRATGCTVRGLAISGFDPPLLLWNCRSCRVVRCYLGVTLGGRRWAPGDASLRLLDSAENTIGGTDPRDRNVIAVGKYYGILLSTRDARPATTSNVIAGNYIGLTPDGSGVLNTSRSEGPTGINVGGDQTVGNVIGGTTDGAGNVFGGMTNGVTVFGAKGTKIKGNLFGLKADGDSLAWIGTAGIVVASAATDTQIGGRAPRARNVFAGGQCSGVQVRGAGTTDTLISGNYFGTNRDGTQRRRLNAGVWIYANAGRTTIGGRAPDDGNYFTPSHPDYLCRAIDIAKVSGRIIVRYNHLGVLPQGGVRPGIGEGVSAYDGDVRILDNEIARAYTGVYVLGVQDASVQRNLFRQCDLAVWARGGPCSLGNLGNSQTNDDGGNEFRASNAMFIANTTGGTLKAEGNIFPTTVQAEIDAKIIDALDCAPLGRVDFDPLSGGVSPTGSAALSLLTATAAVPTNAGAQVTFGLASAAQVQARVLNIAGRPIKTLCRAKDCDSGTNTLLWNAQSDTGLPVPNGTYLIEMTAKAEDGRQGRALTQVSIRR